MIPIYLDPDLTKADGIYSGYVTQLDRLGGRYQMEVEVSDDSGRASFPVRIDGGQEPDACCGSSMPFGGSEPTPRFRRFINGPDFVVKATAATEDDDNDNGVEIGGIIIDYPPSRIADLRVQSVDQLTTEAELTWTAPGSDLDSGTASQYEIRCYTDRSALNDSSAAILVHASLTPRPDAAGSVQLAKVAVPWPNQLFYYAIVALDAAGQRGAVSNIVPVFIDEPPTTTTLAPTTLSPFIGDEESSSSSGIGRVSTELHRVEAASALSRQQLIYVVAGAVAGFILLLAVLSAAVCVSSRRRRRNNEKASGSVNNNNKNQHESSGQLHTLKKMPTTSSTVIKVEPLTVQKSTVNDQQQQQSIGDPDSRPVYKIYVNNAYIQVHHFLLLFWFSSLK